MSKLALFEIMKHDQTRYIFALSSNKDHAILVLQALFEKYWNAVMILQSHTRTN